ncbi:MAG TPA: hypothetical protein VMC62_08585 [Longilinea sp.]|nr:hypothetical protein [Longilinea sp.]
MKSNRWIDLSRRVYARLLHLYPNEHRLEYGESMLQVFTDQLHSAYRNEGGRGVFSLWLRTLWDLGVSALKEQFSSPHLTAGLLEAVPNSPLPWKGVALVLVPGLIFFIAQISQLSGQDLFFLMVYRAGYFLIIPVLLVWVWQRKFPVWGLVPLGLLFRTVWDLGYRVINLQLDPTNPVWLRLLEWEWHHPNAIKIAVISAAFAIVLLLIVMIAIRQRLTRQMWFWLGAYGLLCACYLMSNYSLFYYNESYLVDFRLFLTDVAPSLLYDNAGFLLLILLGAFLAKRHGRLAMLLAMGYLLPTVLYGRFANYWNSLPEQVINTFLLLISITVLVYRFVIALAAPLWVVRSAGEGAQKKASLITLLVVLGIQAAMNIGVGAFMGFFYQYTGWSWVQWYDTIAAELIAAAGVGLASSLYGNVVSTPLQYSAEQLVVEAK